MVSESSSKMDKDACMHFSQTRDDHVLEDKPLDKAVGRTVVSPSSDTSQDLVDNPGLRMSTPRSTQSISTSTGSYYSCLSTPTRLASGPITFSFPDHLLQTRQSPTSIIDPPTSSALDSSSQPQTSFSRSWSNASWINPSDILSSAAYDSISPSIEDSASSIQPEPQAFASTNTLPSPYFEDDFTAYLDELLLAVLEDEDKRFRQYSYSSIASEISDSVLIDTNRIPEQIRRDSRTPKQIGGWKTFWTSSEIVYPTDINYSGPGSESYSHSCSECSSAWTSRSTSITQSEPQAATSFYEPNINTSRFSSSDSDSSTSCSTTTGNGGDSDQSPNVYSAETSRSQTRSLSSDSQERAWTPISPSRNLASLVYQYDEDEYSTDEDEDRADEGSFENRPTSKQSASFFADDRSEEQTPVPTATGTPNRNKPKRRLSLGSEDDGAEDQPPSNNSGGTYNTDAKRDLPSFKKRKLDARPSRSLTSIQFSATQPASLRRGLSLRSIDDDDFPRVKTESNAPLASPSKTDCPPTVPTTPTPTQASYSKPHIFSRNATYAANYYLPPSPIPTKINPRSFKVPIIAPPPFQLIPKAHLSAEDAAEGRLRVLLERERAMRVGDGLGVGIFGAWEAKAGEGVREMNGRMEDGEGEKEEDEMCESAKEVRSPEAIEKPLRPTGPSCVFHSTTADNLLNLGIDDSFRREVINWMLEVLPLPPTSTASTDSSYAFSFDLYDQLSTSPETRFHAAYMFIRYLLRVVAENSGNGNAIEFGLERRSISMERRCRTDSALTNDEDNVDPHFLKDATRTVIWDIAVGCLALSVKFHRDFLAPLYPVYALDFISLATHTMAYDDLEVSQRDILQAFSFSLSGHIMPQPFLDELWLALPTLRALLDFKDGWKDAKRETWERLFGVILEPDILRFPISLLTISVLISGVIISLVDHYEAEAESRLWHQHQHQQLTSQGIQPRCHCDCVSASGLDRVQKALKDEDAQRRYMRRAVKAVEGVILDMTDLVGIRDEDLRECRVWFAGLGQ